MMSWGCGAHQGDNLFTLSYLLKCPGHHTLYVKPEFVQELRYLVADTNIWIESADGLPANSEDTWMANGRHESAHNLYFRNQEDIIGFIFEYFNAFGKAWNERSDMLFNFPWLKPQPYPDLVLVLNSQPMSGQCPGYSQDEMNQLERDLVLDGHRVIRICDDQGGHKYSLLQIACLSAQSKLIIGGASAPFFVTMNTASKNAHRIVLLDPMRIDYGPTVGPIYMARNATEARTILKEQRYMRFL